MLRINSGLDTRSESFLLLVSVLCLVRRFSFAALQAYWFIIFFLFGVQIILLIYCEWRFRIWRYDARHSWSYRLRVVVIGLRARWNLALRRILRLNTFKHLLVLLLRYCPLGEISHRGSLHDLLLAPLKISPVIWLSLHQFNPLLEVLFILNEPLDFKNWVFVLVLLQNGESLSKVFVFILNLENLCILVIDQLRLLLDRLS
jgi:hypothetical protein